MPDLVAFLLFLLPLAYSPGPGNLFFAANGARFGVRGTVPALIGYHMATWVVSVAVGLGFLALLMQVPGLMPALQLGGGLYVLWLAVKFLRAGVLDGAARAVQATWGDGAVLLLLNPKAYVIIALIFTQFLPSDGARWIGVFWIATIFTLNNLGAFLIWAWAGDGMGRLFATARGARGMNIGFALLLAGTALWLLAGVDFAAS